jgi:5'-3' exonuclease
MKYILIDSMNLYFRALYVVHGDDIETKIGMAMQIMFSSVNKVWRDFGGDHVVFCFEGGSTWRKQVYAPYKANRADRTKGLSPREMEEDKKFFESFLAFKEFLTTKTNATVMAVPGAEADDCIALWIAAHQDDEHVIISSDSDFYQLITPSVTQYNGISNQHITLDGIFDSDNKPVIDKKTKEQKMIGDPEWLLFEKCIRGDKADNVFTAYPGARTKGTKKKIGMIQAFEDRNSKGFDWNNFMLTRWVDPNEVEHTVREDYLRNKKIIDLTQQPDDIIVAIDEAINIAANAEPITQIGFNFLRFCGEYDLVRLGSQSPAHVQYLAARYGKK